MYAKTEHSITAATAQFVRIQKAVTFATSKESGNLN